MKDSPVTLRDVAEAAGVHVATASRALNASTSHRVNGATAARIMEVAGRLGYHVNPMARGLRTQRSMSVGVLIPDLTNPYYPPLIRGIDDELTLMKYIPLLANTDNSLNRERILYEQMRARRVDGFIMATARLRHPLIRSAAQEGVPLVLVSRAVPGVDLPAVALDDAAAMRLAVTHLVELGHKAIGHVAGPQDVSTGLNRRTAFLAACKAAGIKTHPVVNSDAFSVEGGHAAAEELLARHAVTAIVAANDLIALGCLGALEELGLRCPRDVSVIGVNDMPYLARISPPLTTISSPTYQMGRSAAQLLLTLIQTPGMGSSETRVMAPQLVVRKSTSRPPEGQRKTMGHSTP